MDAEVWCVWALLPNKKGPDGFSMILNGMTQSEAERAVECSTFQARAMVAGKSAGFKPAALEPPPVGTRPMPKLKPAPAPVREPTPAPAPLDVRPVAPASGQGVTFSFRKA